MSIPRSTVAPRKSPRPAPRPATPFTITTPIDLSGLRFKARASTLGFTVHCSATRPSQNFTVRDMDRMHRQRGFLCVGYHLIIRRDGIVEQGRPLNAMGAHCADGGRNSTHIGICLIGGVTEKPGNHIPGSPWNGSDAEPNFTKKQLASLTETLTHLKGIYGALPVEGHRDVKGVRKACPSFQVDHWLDTGKVIL